LKIQKYFKVAMVSLIILYSLSTFIPKYTPAVVN
jgi:hypothetical protein